MAGRHSAPKRRSQPRSRTAISAALVLALAGGLGYGAYALLSSGGPTHITAATRAPSQVASTPASARPAACTGNVQVPVVVAPEVLTATQAIARDWARTRPSVSGTCVTTTVRASTPARAAADLTKVSRPTVWISDSGVWTARLAAARPGIVAASTSVATSPLVVAAPAAGASAIQAEARSGWAGVLGGNAPVVITDPATNAPAALVTLAAAGQAGTTAGRARVVGLFLRLSRTTLATPLGGFAQLKSLGAHAPGFVTSELAVHAAVSADSSLHVTVVHPTGPTPALDYPAVQLVPKGADPTAAAAAAAFARALQSGSAHARFATAGLRDPQCHPMAGGPSNVPVQLAAAPGASQRATAQRLWQAAVKPSQLLAVMDVSGSMKDPAVRGGTAKIVVASRAAQAAMHELPDDWRVGLWSFATPSGSTSDWRQLTPIGKVATNRQQLLAAAASLPKHSGGNTALYRTALDAFERVRGRYDPSSVNVVALLTDGSNVDPGSRLTLKSLLAKLRADYDPRKPVHIVTIGFGRDADTAALRAISAATGGQSYQVNDPAQIQTVLLESIVANN
ncbi:MAG TPA: substrate-binding domain-containing protein [Jatrophihabitantaceae bacterium]